MFRYTLFISAVCIYSLVNTSKLIAQLNLANHYELLIHDPQQAIVDNLSVYKKNSWMVKILESKN